MNYTTNQSVEVGFTAHPGYPLKGNSAGWVVEAPTVGGSLATMTDYIMIPFWDAYAYTESSVFYDIDEATPVDMTDSTGAVISYPEYLGLETFVMHDEGSAW